MVRGGYRTDPVPVQATLLVAGAPAIRMNSDDRSQQSMHGPTFPHRSVTALRLEREPEPEAVETRVPERVSAPGSTFTHSRRLICTTPNSAIRDIPLSQLELSPDNVRKTPADTSAFTELKASIAAHGLLENLIARAMEPDTDCGARYAVIAGGRRLAAMQALAAEGALDEDHPVPCRMIGGIVAAEEVSLAENSVRAAMHPADQVEAFRRLADAGSTAAAIAARFGVSERTVEKRLRLGNAAPVLLEAYRAGEIDLETLMAFAVTTDQARQSAVWETVSQQGYRPGAWQIKRLLTEDRVPATSAIARFVGIEAYEAAGGRIDRDLFAEEDERGIWFDDPDLLNKLAMDSLQAAARELKTRWKWAEARLDVDWSATAAFGRVRPQPAEPTDEEKAEIERLRTRNGELANMDDEDWTEELVEEADANETRLDEIEATIEARAVYRREDIAIAGCIATIGNDGELKLIQGLVRPEDMPARESGDADAAGHDDTGDEENTISGIDAPTFVAPLASPGDAEAEARKEAGVGIGLADDLRAIRTAIVKSQLACDFEAAFDLLLFQLARSVFTSGYHDDALDIRATETPGPSGHAGQRRRFRHRQCRREAPRDRPGRAKARLDRPVRCRGLRRTAGASRTGQTDPVRVLCRAHAEGPTGVRTQSPAGGRSDRRPARHRLRCRCPRQSRSGLDRRSAVVAFAQGPHPRHRPRRRWARPGRKRRPSRRRRTSPRRCRTLSPTATMCPPGSRPRAAPRPSPGRRPASAPSIPAPSMTKVHRQMTRGRPPPTRNRRKRIRRWRMRRWAIRRKKMAMMPTVAPIHRAPTAKPRNPGIRRPVLRRTMSPIPLRRRHRSP